MKTLTVFQRRRGVRASKKAGRISDDSTCIRLGMLIAKIAEIFGTLKEASENAGRRAAPVSYLF